MYDVMTIKAAVGQRVRTRAHVALTMSGAQDRPDRAGRLVIAVSVLSLILAAVLAGPTAVVAQPSASPEPFVGRVFSLDMRDDVSIVSTQVILMYDDGFEVMVIEPTLQPIRGRGLWVIPMPVRPEEVSRDDPAIFASLERMTRKGAAIGLSQSGRNLTQTMCEEIVPDHWFPRRPVQALDSFGPEDNERLASWLRTHEASSRDDVRAWLDARLSEGSHLVVALIDLSAFEPAPLDAVDPRPASIVQPVRIVFSSSSPWMGDQSNPAGIMASAPEPSPCDPVVGASACTVYTLTREPMATGNAFAAGPQGRPATFELYPFESLPPISLSRKSGLPWEERGLHPALGDEVFGSTWEGAWVSKFAFDRLPSLVEVYTFDPITWMQSEDEGMRALAFTVAGQDPSRDRMISVLEQLAQTSMYGADRLSALWALSQSDLFDSDLQVQIGAAVLEYGLNDEPAVNIEAMEALAKLNRPEATEACLRILERHLPSSWAQSVARLPFDRGLMVRPLIEVAHRILVERRDVTAIERLQALRDTWEDRWTYPPSWLPNTFVAQMSRAEPTKDAIDDYWTVLTALVASGDLSARSLTVETLVDEGATSGSRESVLARSRSKGIYNYYPMAVWGGRLALNRPVSIRGWPSLPQVYTRLAPQPSLRDSLFRHAAADDRLPDSARAALYGHLESLEPADAKELRGVWMRALEDPLLVRSTSFVWTYNVPACLAAYAMGATGGADALRRWVYDLDDDLEDEDGWVEALRAEVAFALAQSEQPSAWESLASYIRTAWTESADRLTQILLEGNSASGIFSRYDRFDEPYRARAIHQYVAASPGGPRLISALIQDSSVHPLIRLYWMARAPYHQETFSGLIPRALTLLNDLERSNDPRLQGLDLDELVVEVRNSLGRFADAG